MLGAGNMGNMGNARNAREIPFERMFDAVLGLVSIVFVTRQLIGFPLCTLWLGPTPIPTGAEPNTEPDTVPTNQANQLNSPPPLLSLWHTNSSGSGSGVNSMTRTRYHPYSRSTTPGPLAHKHRSPARFLLLAEIKRTRRQEPATSHADSSSNSSTPQREKWVCPYGTRCDRLWRPRNAKPGCGATT